MSPPLLQVRGFALGVATMINRTTSGTVAVSFLSLSHWLTPAGAYYMFAAIAAAAFAFLHARVPETKGKSLEDIEKEMLERHMATTSLLDGRRVGATSRPAGTELSGPSPRPPSSGAVV